MIWISWYREIFRQFQPISAQQILGSSIYRPKKVYSSTGTTCYISTRGFWLPSNGHLLHIVDIQGLSFTIHEFSLFLKILNFVSTESLNIPDYGYLFFGIVYSSCAQWNLRWKISHIIAFNRFLYPTRELSLCHKLKVYTLYIPSTWSCKPFIFQTERSFDRTQFLYLKYSMSTTLGCKDVRIKNSKFVADSITFKNRT